jgi:HNH endonuclease/NUMOD4 motif
VEEWRDIPGYEGLYQVSSLGRVRRLPRPTYGSNVNGYKEVYLPDGNICYGHSMGTYKQGSRAFVHRLVAAAFLGFDLKSGLDINHKDGNPKNNEVSNLEVVTRSENIRHAHTLPWRSHHHPHKLTKQQYLEIRARYAAGGCTYRGLATEYEVSPGAVRHVLKFRSRKDECV